MSRRGAQRRLALAVACRNGALHAATAPAPSAERLCNVCAGAAAGIWRRRACRRRVTPVSASWSSTMASRQAHLRRPRSDYATCSRADAAMSSAISGAPTPVSASRSDRRPRANRIRAIRSVDDATCSKQMRRCGNVERSQRPVDAGVGELVSTAPDTLDRLSRGDGRQPPSRRRDARPAGAPHRIAGAWTCLRRTRATGERASRRWARSGAELA